MLGCMVGAEFWDSRLHISVSLTCHHSSNLRRSPTNSSPLSVCLHALPLGCCVLAVVVQLLGWEATKSTVVLYMHVRQWPNPSRSRAGCCRCSLHAAKWKVPGTDLLKKPYIWLSAELGPGHLPVTGTRYPPRSSLCITVKEIGTPNAEPIATSSLGMIWGHPQTSVFSFRHC